MNTLTFDTQLIIVSTEQQQTQTTRDLVIQARNTFTEATTGPCIIQTDELFRKITSNEERRLALSLLWIADRSYRLSIAYAVLNRALQSQIPKRILASEPETLFGILRSTATLNPTHRSNLIRIVQILVEDQQNGTDVRSAIQTVLTLIETLLDNAMPLIIHDVRREILST
jgi:hypothetical protein